DGPRPEPSPTIHFIRSLFTHDLGSKKETTTSFGSVRRLHCRFRRRRLLPRIASAVLLQGSSSPPLAPAPRRRAAHRTHRAADPAAQRPIPIHPHPTHDSIDSVAPSPPIPPPATLPAPVQPASPPNHRRIDIGGEFLLLRLLPPGRNCLAAAAACPWRGGLSSPAAAPQNAIVGPPSLLASGGRYCAACLALPRPLLLPPPRRSGLPGGLGTSQSLRRLHTGLRRAPPRLVPHPSSPGIAARVCSSPLGAGGSASGHLTQTEVPAAIPSFVLHQKSAAGRLCLSFAAGIHLCHLVPQDNINWPSAHHVQICCALNCYSKQLCIS
ncbi:hypothetical protein U9M48_000801, partial [Paspalum notatum var. saurae]